MATKFRKETLPSLRKHVQRELLYRPEARALASIERAFGAKCDSLQDKFSPAINFLHSACPAPWYFDQKRWLAWQFDHFSLSRSLPSP